MGLRYKILSGFLILAIMLGIAGAWSIFEIKRALGSIKETIEENYHSINAGRMMLIALDRENSAVLLLLSGKWEEGRVILKEADELFKKGFDIASSNIAIPDEKERIEKIKRKYQSYKALWLKPIVGTRGENDLKWYFNDMFRLYMNIKKEVDELISMNEGMIYNIASSLQSRSHRAVMPGIVAILSTLIFTLIFNYFINYYIISPLLRITEGIKRYIDKGAPFDVRIETRDELFELSNSVRELLIKIKRLKEDRKENR